MIRRLHLQDRVFWVPWVHSDEVVDYMNAFDVLSAAFAYTPQLERAIWQGPDRSHGV